MNAYAAQRALIALNSFVPHTYAKITLHERFKARHSERSEESLFFDPAPRPQPPLHFAPLQLIPQNLKIRLTRRMNQFQPFRRATNAYAVANL